MKLKNFNKNAFIKTNSTYKKFIFKYLIEYSDIWLTFKYHKNDYILMLSLKELPYDNYYKNLKVSIYTSSFFPSNIDNIYFKLYLK